MSNSGYSAIEQQNFNKQLLFRDMQFSTKCCHIASIEDLLYWSVAEFEQIAVFYDL